MDKEYDMDNKEIDELDAFTRQYMETAHESSKPVFWDVICPFCNTIFEVEDGSNGECPNCSEIFDDKGNVV
jgi:rubrerythrin